MAEKMMEKVSVTRDQVLNSVVMCVESGGADKEPLDVLTFDYLDLHVVYRLQLGVGTSAKITHESLAKQGFTEFDIMSAAIKNTRAKLEVRSLGEILGMPDGIPVDCIKFKDNEMFGAAGICFAEIFKELCEKRGVGHCYILPSSVHEILVHYPIDTFATKEDLDAMVQAVNAAEVAPEEVLADHCYVYELETNTITY